MVTIQTEGDLEVVVLLETHSLLARIISPDFYVVAGTRPEQNVAFHDRVRFDFFIVLAHEFIAKSQDGVTINGKPEKISLLTGLERVAKLHASEANQAGLNESLAELNAWLDTNEAVPFAPPAGGKHISITLSRRKILNLTANGLKHHLLRLSSQLSILKDICSKAGHNFNAHELMDVNRQLTSRLHEGLAFYQTWLIELLGNLFYSVNSIVVRRYNENPTNDVSKMKMPAGVVSDVMQELYADLLVFQNYSDQRITDFTPATASVYRKAYWP